MTNGLKIYLDKITSTMIESDKITMADNIVSEIKNDLDDKSLSELQEYLLKILT